MYVSHTYVPRLLYCTNRVYKNHKNLSNIMHKIQYKSINSIKVLTFNFGATHVVLSKLVNIFI